MITILISKPNYHKDGLIIGQPFVFDGFPFAQDSNSSGADWPTTPTVRVSRAGKARLGVLLTNQDVELMVLPKGADPADPIYTPLPIRAGALTLVSYSFFMEGDEADIYVREIP